MPESRLRKLNEWRSRLVRIAAVLLLIAAPTVVAAPLDPEVTAFIEEFSTRHEFDRGRLQRWFAQARVQPGIIKAMMRPTTALPWHEFRASHVSPARIKGGLEYWDRYAAQLAQVSADTGVPAEIMVATIGIESFYGRRVGTVSVFNALYTLAFNYPPRAARFRSELAEFLLLTRELNVDPLQVKGSYAGALGVPQFLPSSYRQYAVDTDGDGKRDLWAHGDAIASVANYYKSYGWQAGAPVLAQIEQSPEPVSEEFKTLVERGISLHTTVAAIRKTGATPSFVVDDDAKALAFAAETEAGMRYWIGFNNFYVITRYNRSVNYALAVYELAQEIRDQRRSAPGE